MKKLTLILFYFILFFSCNNGFRQSSNPVCKTFYKSISVNWVAKGNFLYGFKNNPEYWKAEVYLSLINEDCLLGLTKKSIIELFQEPTKQFLINQNSKRLDVFIYCLDKSCIDSKKMYGGREIRFIFDENERLKLIGTNPVITQGIEIQY